MANRSEFDSDDAVRPAPPYTVFPPNDGAANASPAPSALATQLRVAFNYTGGVHSESKFDIMHATSDADMFRTGLLFERADQRLPSSNRLLIYDQTPCISLSVPLHTLQVQVQAFLRECVCMSTVFVLSAQREVTKETPVLFVFVEFPPGQDMFLLDGYVNNVKDNRLQCLQWMWTRMFPALEFLAAPDTDPAPVTDAPATSAASPAPVSVSATDVLVTDAHAMDDFNQHDSVSRSLALGFHSPAPVGATGSGATVPETPGSAPNPSDQLTMRGAAPVAVTPSTVPLVQAVNAVGLLAPPPSVLVPKAPYHPESHKLFVLLDLDKTLFLSDADAREEQRHAFVGDFEIAGNMAITNERFQHRMMIRPGCYLFLRRLAQIAEIFVITAGDLHYARAAVSHANVRHWVSSNDPTTNNVDPATLDDVSIPLTRVFSVRNHAKRAAPKTFERALPFAQFMTTGAGCAVLAVDDDPGAWDVSVRHHVIPISPFQPLNNSHEHLFHVVWLIEQAAQRFFNNIHSDMAKLPEPALPAFPVVEPVAKPTAVSADPMAVSAVGAVGAVGVAGATLGIEPLGNQSPSAHPGDDPHEFKGTVEPVRQVTSSPGASELVQSENSGVVNAIGAAIGTGAVVEPPVLPVTAQFFDSGRYVKFSTGLTFDCSNGANKMLNPAEVTQFYAEHAVVGQSHTLESPPGVPVGVQFFEDGRYVLLATETRTPFLAFKYGGVMHFPTLKPLEDFLATVKPLAPPCYVGGAGAVGTGAAGDAGDASDAGANVVEAPLVQFFNRGRYGVRTAPNMTPVVFDYANGGLPIEHLSTDPVAFQQFISRVTQDRKCDKPVKVLVKTKKIVEVIQSIVNSP